MDEKDVMEWKMEKKYIKYSNIFSKKGFSDPLGHEWG